MPLPSDPRIFKTGRTLTASLAQLRRVQDTVLPRSRVRLAATNQALSTTMTRQIETWERIESAPAAT